MMCSSIARIDDVAGRFEFQVEQYPNYIALRDQSIEYTYIALNERANQLALWLSKKSIKSGDFVAIYLEPSANFILYLLAILKVGAAYVPLDRFAPAGRLKAILSDTAPTLLLTEKINSSIFAGIHVTTSFIEDIDLESVKYDNSNLSIPIFSDWPCYMMYTSGTTGRPKGVVVPHRAVINLIEDNALNMGPSDTMAQFSNLAFDGSTFDIWTSLLHASTLIVIPQEARGNHHKLQTALKENQIKYLFLPTGYLHQLVNSYPETLDGVNNILIGGEQINPRIIKSFFDYRKQKNIPICIVNGYGPTETTGYVCRQIIDGSDLNDDFLSSIGRAIPQVKLYLLDKNLNEVSEGELCISGASLALGYHQSSLTEEKFVINPFEKKTPYTYLYKTGDLVKRLPNGDLLCLGRLDDQVKIGGFRINLNEIEQQLMNHEDINLAAVTAELGGGMYKVLTAYIVFSKNRKLSGDRIHLFLQKSLPHYMIPAKYIAVNELPLTPTGKVDKNRLDKVSHMGLPFHEDTFSASQTEETIKQIWKNLLNKQHIESNINLFELGANSLLLTEACVKINEEFAIEMQITDLLALPTIRQIAQFLKGYKEISPKQERPLPTLDDVAIVGMSCRFPKANNLNEFWERLCKGEDCISQFAENDAQNTVATRGILNNIEQFDASFFNFTPIDASIADPQLRLFLECTWEALEHAAIAPSKSKSKVISVFAGMSDSTYLHENLLKNQWVCQEVDALQQRIATSPGMLSTQVSYRLNFKGKSVNVNTACSTGLITVEQACQDLLLRQSDIAIAGASNIMVPQLKPYIYQQGGILSPDGYCRPFSDKANGTVFSNGVGVVVLKRLQDAIQDNDTIFAIIRGRGVNNDGKDKLGFAAPSPLGQMNCIRQALSQAKVEPTQIGFLEAHGTATALGDVIEINALTKVYREQTDKLQYCALGSVKANIGHTDVTAGIAGLIKTVLCLYYKKIPPLVNFLQPNINLSLEKSPFFVNSQLINWDSTSQRYAGVSSFGVGGTNVHLIVSDHIESPVRESLNTPESLIMLSAKSESALEEMTQQLLDYIDTSKAKSSIVDIAYTLQKGREDFNLRRFIVGKSETAIRNNLRKQPTIDVRQALQQRTVFLFSGQGNQYPKMATELMRYVPRFKSYMEKGASLAKPHLNDDLIKLLCNGDHKIFNTEYAQPALFTIEYALARLLMDCGIHPSAFIGHSLGEYVAACLSGVFSFEDAIMLVCQRGRLMASSSKGRMLAIECDVETWLSYQKIFNLELALHNAPNHCVVSGSIKDIDQLVQHFKSIGQRYQQLKIDYAFHSRYMEAIEESFKKLFANISLSPPSIPIISNVTGDWLSDEQAIDPLYWYQHLRQTVQLNKGLEFLLSEQYSLFVEVGPGQSMYHFAKAISGGQANVVYTLPSHHREVNDFQQLLTALGEIWSSGVSIDPEPLYENISRKRLPLPTYPFQRQKYWIEPEQLPPVDHNAKLYKPVWFSRKSYLQPIILESGDLEGFDWIIIKDNLGFGSHFVEILNKHGIKPIVVTFGSYYERHNASSFTINPKEKSHYQEFLKSIKHIIKNPIVLHTTTYSVLNYDAITPKDIEKQLTSGFYSLFYLTQTYTEEIGVNVPLKVNILTSGTQDIVGTENINPIHGTLTAFRFITQQFEAIQIKITDLNPSEEPENNSNLLYKILKATLHHENYEISATVVYRNGYQWNLMYTEIPSQRKINRLKDNGIYLLTGGLGGIALSCCEVIAKTVSNPTFILLSRRAIPPPSNWGSLLKNKNDPDYKKITQLNKLAKAGAKFIFHQVDISDREQIIPIIHQSIARWGEINGLIHAAGVADPESISTRSQQKIDKIFAPKIHGTYYLSEALRNVSLDFVVLHSSISSLLGGSQLLDYSAANSCLNAFAKSDLFSSSKFVVAINWNTWRDVGMAFDAAQNGKFTFLGHGNDISPKQGQFFFLEALFGEESEVAVSKIPIRRKEAKQLSIDKTPHMPVAHQKLHNVQYKAPTRDIECKLVQLWQDALGIKNIGIRDDFFSLGGHSLNALSLIQKINKTFNSSLPPTQLYRTSTIEKLSDVLLELVGITNSKPSIAIPLKVIKKTPPFLFLCHPISGLINCFDFFINESDLLLSIYGLQDPSLTTNKISYENLSIMAEDYLTAIRKIQPRGPYFLIGYSFGGNLLYEIAYLLQQQEEKINLLAMIDSWAVHDATNSEKHLFKNQLQALGKELPHALIDLAWEREKLLLKHSPAKMKQDMVLFKANHILQEYQFIDSPDNGWSIYNKGKIHCYNIDGDHNTIMNLRQIKNILRILKTEHFNNQTEITI